MKTGYISGYTKLTNKGISSFQWKDNTITNIQLEEEIENPTYFDIKDDKFFSIVKKDGTCGLGYYKIENNHLKRMDLYLHQEIPSCYVNAQEDDIVLCNFHLGTCCIYTIENDKIQLKKVIQEEKYARCHHAFHHENYLYVTFLGLDAIHIYDKNKNYELIDKIIFPKGTGPRHCIVNHEKNILYVLSELSCEIYVIELNTKKTLQILPICRHKENSTGAAIRIGENNKYLYTSCRGDDCIAVFEIEGNRLKFRSFSDTGKHPRDFIVYDDYLLVLHQNDAFIRIFKQNENATLTLEQDIPCDKELVCIK